MRYRQIQPGDALEFFVKLKNNSSEKQRYSSKIVSLFEHNKVFVISATHIHEYDDLNMSEPLEFIVYTKEGVVSFDAVIIKVYSDEDGFFSLVRVVSPVIRAQLRAHARFNAEIPLKYSILHPGEDLVDEPEEIYRGKTKDISSGGARLLISEKLETDTRLRLLIEKREGSVLAESIVINQQESENSDEYNYETRVKFVKLLDNKRRISRTNCNYPLKYAVLSASERYIPGTYIPEEKIKTGEVRDMSPSGLKFIGDMPLIVDSRLDLIIYKPGETWLAEAIVRNHKMLDQAVGIYTYETGVKFVSLNRNSRQFVRYPCFLAMTFNVIDKAEPSHQIMDGKVVDISSGGIKFVSNYILEKDNILQIRVEKASGILFTEASVIQKSILSKKHKNYEYETRVKFLSIKNV